jgi:hypothetical protein
MSNLPLYTTMALTISLILAALVALTIQVFYFSPIDPVLLKISSPLSSTSTKNNQLQVKI